jgi:peroxiredoxin
MRHLQKLYEKYRDRGLVVLGIDSRDEKKIALEFLHGSGATFPTILDSSDAANKIVSSEYGAHGVPVSYILDARHRVVEAWSGYQPGHARALAALKRAGLNVEE